MLLWEFLTDYVRYIPIPIFKNFNRNAMNDILTEMVSSGIIGEGYYQTMKELVEGGMDIHSSAITFKDVSEDKLATFWAKTLGYDYIDSLDGYKTSREFLSKFSAKVLLEKKIAPVVCEDGRVLALIANPFDQTGVDQLRLVSGQDITVALSTAGEIARYIKEHLGLGADTIESMVGEVRNNGLHFLSEHQQEDIDLENPEEGASIIRFVNQILTEAIERRATDVHIEPFEKELRVRYRIDGVLQGASIPEEVCRFQAAIVSRIKILSNLDIAEKRLPQDGRIKVMVSGHQIDIRVSIIPMLHGEAVVLRLLDCSGVIFGLGKIGMDADNLRIFKNIITRPHGIILVTGPTGSGKTTTLYAALSGINDMERKIITIEDPVEYQLRGINQIQVSNKTGLTFARGLRSILRHDPDVILVGEIRDLETAEIAIQSSLTGHLVFSTLHTNDAPGALTRLVDMGVEPYLVASSLEAVIAQRLIRLICPQCKRQVGGGDIKELRGLYGDAIPEKLYKGEGCKNCQNTGYYGRAGIFEQMVVSEDIRSLLVKNAGAGDIRLQAAKEGMKSLRDDVCRYLEQGKTTVEEMLRVTKNNIDLGER